MALDKQAYLDALAQGGQRAADQYSQSQAAMAAQQQQGIQGALAQAAQNNMPTGAAQQLAQITNQGVDARLAQSKSNATANAQYAWANGQALGGFLDKQGGIEKQIAAELAAKMAGSGGGGGGSGGSGGSGSGDGSGDGGVQNISDIIKQIRNDAGLKGTGLTAAKYTQAYLADSTKQDQAYAGMPRDLRAQQYAMDHYGLPSEFLDAVAPVGGFLKQMQSDMVKSQQGKLSAYDPTTGKTGKVATSEDFLRYLKFMAQRTGGNQSKAVAYLKNQIKGRSTSPQPAAPAAKKPAAGGIGRLW